MTDKKIGWLLESLEDTAGVEYAVLVAADGMSPAHTDRLPRERAEKISAIASTLWGASRAYDRETSGGASASSSWSRSTTSPCSSRPARTRCSPYGPTAPTRTSG